MKPTIGRCQEGARTQWLPNNFISTADLRVSAVAKLGELNRLLGRNFPERVVTRVHHSASHSDR